MTAPAPIDHIAQLHAELVSLGLDAVLVEIGHAHGQSSKAPLVRTRDGAELIHGGMIVEFLMPSGLTRGLWSVKLPPARATLHFSPTGAAAQALRLLGIPLKGLT